MPAPESSSEVLTIVTTGDIILDALIEGGRWANSEITYSFPDYGSFWSTDPVTGYGPNTDIGREPWGNSFSPLSDSDQTYFIEALHQWENVANVHFVIVADTETDVGDIRIAYSHNDEIEGAQAWAYTPSSTAAISGDIWIDLESSSADEIWKPGTYSFLTLIHEIGHALGLSHPFDDSQFPNDLDTMSSTIMSYSAIAGDQDSGFSYYPTTPMPLDILAIQYLYGQGTIQSINNDYFFNDSITYHETIWDNGGTSDRIAYNGSQNATIDLREGMGSFIGNSVYAEDFFTETRVPNIWIAYHTVIENAIGGLGDDILIGNDADNTLNGNSGEDTAIFAGLFSQAQVEYMSDSDLFLVTTSSGGTDSVTNIEFFSFEDITISRQDLINKINDALPVLTVENITVTEGPGTQTATFVIESSASGNDAITGSFEIIAGTATAGSDFQADSGTFTIPVGAVSTTIDVSILDDTAVENTETFQLRLFDVSNAELSGGGSTVTATAQIKDTDNGGNSPSVDPNSDITIVQRGVVSKAAGDDIYVISSFTVDPNASITISDAHGANKIQLIGGLNIDSTIVASNTAQLALSNGAEIVILGAAFFTYETGGNPLLGVSGILNNYADFASNILGTDVPAASDAPNSGGAVIIDSNSAENISALSAPSEEFELIEDGEIDLIQGYQSAFTTELVA
ncbi:Matrixin [Nitrosomonas marina]|uniref:Matrixin n=1 Tax=Nitrosomonas marina TaxID=917 RepID=A0A1I0CRS9_9PROT|nr:matrixin family metalloprotease [Nitrosomonas marina]SET22486.1 Matrixin [Nitrosomonas marina]